MSTIIYISNKQYRHTSADGRGYMAHDLFVNNSLLQNIEFGGSVPKKFHFQQGAMTFIPEPHIQSSLRKYFAGFHSKETPAYDCRAFACDVLSVEYHTYDDMHLYVMFEQVQDIFEHQGEVIYHMSNGIFKHASVVLGPELLMSVWGGGGQLTVTNSSSTLKAFRMTDTYVVSKR